MSLIASSGVSFVEQVPVEHHEVGMVARLDGADVLLAEEPFLRRGGDPDCLVAREVLGPEDQAPNRFRPDIVV
jgi:hypothetical protein